MPYNLEKRRSFRGRSFQTLGPATENARFCMDAGRANGTTRTLSQQSEALGYLGPPTLADRDRLGRRVQGLHCATARFRSKHVCLLWPIHTRLGTAKYGC